MFIIPSAAAIIIGTFAAYAAGLFDSRPTKTPWGLVFTAFAVLALSCLTGCATLVPDTARVELQHTSHASQHEPFTSSPTSFGYDLASVVVHYDLTKHVAVELAEGVVLEHCQQVPGNTAHACGSMMGPRETFTGRVSYTFFSKH